MSTRADKIYEILKENGGRLKVSEVCKLLSKIEETSELQAKVVSSTVRVDNKTKELQGEAPIFDIYGYGSEQYGYISIIGPKELEKSLKNILKKYETQIPALIERANLEVLQLLMGAIRKMSWKQFETNFLQRILKANGFQSIEITQPTRDGGTDAYCFYRRGLVKSEVIVSAKHWSRQKVGKAEVQRLRGIKGNADTGIIITSSGFSAEATKEAAPSQNQRSIVLINGDIVVKTCLKNSIGVKQIKLQNLYKFTSLDPDLEEI